MQWAIGTMTEMLKVMNTFDFMVKTPERLTYGHGVVETFEGWVVTIVDALCVLFLIYAGYQYLFGFARSFRKVIPPLLIALIAAHFCLLILR